MTFPLLLSANKFQGLLENWFSRGQEWEPWVSERTWRSGSIKARAPAKRALQIVVRMWKPTCISSWELSVLKPQFWVQWCYVSTLKLTVEEVFISLILANITNHGHVFLPGGEVTYTSLVLQQETKDKQDSKVLNLVRCFFQSDDTFVNINISFILSLYS